MVLFVASLSFVLFYFEDFSTGDTACHGVLSPSGGRSFLPPSPPAGLRQRCHVDLGWVQLFISMVRLFPSHLIKSHKTFQTFKDLVQCLHLKATDRDSVLRLHLLEVVPEEERSLVVLFSTQRTYCLFIPPELHSYSFSDFTWVSRIHPDVPRITSPCEAVDPNARTRLLFPSSLTRDSYLPPTSMSLSFRSLIFVIQSLNPSSPHPGFFDRRTIPSLPRYHYRFMAAFLTGLYVLRQSGKALKSYLVSALVTVMTCRTTVFQIQTHCSCYLAAAALKHGDLIALLGLKPIISTMQSLLSSILGCGPNLKVYPALISSKSLSMFCSNVLHFVVFLLVLFLESSLRKKTRLSEIQDYVLV